MKDQHPLAHAEVRVEEEPGMPGRLRCTLFLLPHYQLGEMTRAIRAATIYLGGG